MIKSLNFTHKFVPQLLIRFQNFGLSATNSAWKPRPIHESEEEIDEDEKYLELFKSRKGISSDVLHSVPKVIELTDFVTVSGIKSIRQTLKQRKLVLDQRFIDKRMDVLGFDLGAAHFLLHRGGKVRFKDHDEWAERDEDLEYDLPHLYDPTFFIEDINMSTLPIIYDGLQNIDKLYYLKRLNASGCPHIDDWCMDRICGQFADTLEELDISHCMNITEKGVEAIGKLSRKDTDFSPKCKGIFCEETSDGRSLLQKKEVDRKEKPVRRGSVQI